MFKKDEKYYLKIDNKETMHQVIINEIIDDNIIHGQIQLNESSFVKIEFTNVNYTNLEINNDYYLFIDEDDYLKKINIVNEPVYDTKLNSMRIKVRIFGEQKLHSKGIINLYMPLDSTKMYFYKLNIIKN